MNRLPLVDRVTLNATNKKISYTKQLFSIVAPKYDLINKLMSLNRDQHWKNYLISKISEDREKIIILDIASGTGDIAFQLRKKFPAAHIIASDLSIEMLRQGHQKNRQWCTLCNDMSEIPIVNSSVDYVTGSYALRNAPSLESVLKEIHRVLRPGGRAFLLDFSLFRNVVMQKIELFILFFWGSLFGIFFHHNAAIYAYIAESLRSFPNRDQLRQMIIQHDFKITEEKLFFFGFIAFVEILK